MTLNGCLVISEKDSVVGLGDRLVISEEASVVAFGGGLVISEGTSVVSLCGLSGPGKRYTHQHNRENTTKHMKGNNIATQQGKS